MKNKDFNFKPVHLYKPGTKKYYRDTLKLIVLYANLYEKFTPNSFEEAKSLLKSMKEMAEDTLNHKAMYYKLENENEL